MVQGIDSINGLLYQPRASNASERQSSGSLNNFDVEDKAIISAQAKLLNALEKFNNGEGDILDLAVTSITSKIEVAANVQVIKSKEEMMDKVLEMMD